jgi:hypothetical protein
MIQILISIIGVMGSLLVVYINYKIKEKGDRREFLVDIIKDKDMPLSTRQAAAVEYIDSGFNGVTRDYIIKNKLYVKNPIPDLK